MVFYLAIDGAKSDPLSRFQVFELIESGQVSRSTLAWSHGMTAWLPLEEIPEFSRDFENVELGTAGEEPEIKSPRRRATAATAAAAAGTEVRKWVGVGNKEEVPQSKDKARPAPWMRLFARGVDIILLYTAALGVISLFPGLVPAEADLFLAEMVALLILVVAGCLIEALFLSTWGYTPGKALFRVCVRGGHGEIISYKTALQRSFLVWVKGLALMFPWVTPIALMIAHARLMVFGSTTWDRDLRLEVTHGKPGQLQIAVAVLIYVTYAVLIYREVEMHLEQVRIEEEKAKEEKEREKLEEEAGEATPPVVEPETETETETEAESGGDP